jgi:mutual gliding-motility protein MglA
MSFINYSSREINCKIVYYGPGLCGKTTNLQYIYNKTNPDAKGKMISLATETERTLFFDFLPLALGEIRGFKTRFHLYTVPGQVFYDASRKLILKGVDGVVFVADSQIERMEANIESLENLRTNLAEQGYDLDKLPYVVQYNKRDLPNAAPLEELRVEGNYAEALESLPAVVARLHADGKKACVTTPAVPRETDLPHVGRLIDAAARAGADALEVHSLGVLRMLRERGKPIPAHMGAYANVYTHLAAAVMRDSGAVRVRPNAEVSLDEMAVIAREASVEIELLVHGKIPLGVTDNCFLIEGPEESDPNCPAACREEHWLKTSRWALKTVGKGVLSGRDMCMLEHLPRLVRDGFRIFRVEGLYETASYRSEIGAVYREALSRAFGRGEYAVEDSWASAVRRHAKRNLCNGYYFGTSGRKYVGELLQRDDPGIK